MTKEIKKQMLKKIELNKKALKENGVAKIGIFGSVLKNKQTKKNGIDVLIKFDAPSFDRYAEAMMILEKALKKKIDLIAESSLRPELAYVRGRQNMQDYEHRECIEMQNVAKIKSAVLKAGRAKHE